MPESTTVRLRLSPVGLMTSSRNLRSISFFRGACQLWTKCQSEKHRHETNYASVGSPEERCRHYLKTLAERTVKERPYWSSCSSREMEFLQKLDGSTCAVDLMELLNYYIADEL
ncbi:hypothetical protein T01_16067 [Trichinella spiralis]|uniref:Uncharacterized protein n=1 Tax=Trichinella spiralis TaxID=6334 RepID=A0A0V1BM25_TRISP|nr:hypothetical protein T01_16067 [Trichinella spiralis]